MLMLIDGQFCTVTNAGVFKKELEQMSLFDLDIWCFVWIGFVALYASIVWL